MNKRIWFGLALCSAAAAMAQTSRAVPAGAIDVEVVNGRAVVAAPSVRTGTGQVTLQWRLLTPGYRFTNDSISFFDAADYFNCSTFNYGQGIRCTKSADAPTGRIRYSVVVSSGGGAVVEDSDPNIWVVND